VSGTITIHCSALFTGLPVTALFPLRQLLAHAPLDFLTLTLTSVFGPLRSAFRSAYMFRTE